jgi:hypothetical protein
MQHRLVAAPITFSSEVRGGSREENASKKDSGDVMDMQHGPH